MNKAWVKTRVGRRVYDRKKHYMNVTAATRILKNSITATNDYNLPQIVAFYAAILPHMIQMLNDFFLLLKDNPDPIALQQMQGYLYTILKEVGTVVKDRLTSVWYNFIAFFGFGGSNGSD